MADYNDILAQLFEERFGVAPSEAVLLPASGSGRRYYRLVGGVRGVAGGASSSPRGTSSAVADAPCGASSSVADAPLSRAIGVVSGNIAENEAFVYLSEHFRSRGIKVPEIYAVTADKTAYLQQDLGGESLFSAISFGRSKAQAAFKARGGNSSSEFCGAGSSLTREGGSTPNRVDCGEIYSAEEERLLCAAIAKLPEIQVLGAEGLDFSRCCPVAEMDARSIMFDLNYFKYCYLLPSCVEFDELRLQDDFGKLTSVLLSERADTFMYRDFQSRNVMMLDGEPYFIDYQGGRKGPIYYDVASFVWQASSCFPADLKGKLLDAYLFELGKYRGVSRDEFMSRLRIFLLFRMIQVLGAYGFRGLYQRKSHFIESIPFALENLRGLLAEFNEPFEICPYLSQLLLTLVEKGSFAGTEAVVTPSVGSGDGRLTVKITSFSYKDGTPQDDSGNGGGYIFDCRGLNNPGRYEEYRNSTGRDADVIEFIEGDGGVFPFLEGVYAMVDPHVENFITRGFTSLCVNFGCTGGHHRSVYCAEALAKHIAAKFPNVEIVLTHSRLGIVRRINGHGEVPFCGGGSVPQPSRGDSAGRE